MYRYWECVCISGLCVKCLAGQTGFTHTEMEKWEAEFYSYPLMLHSYYLLSPAIRDWNWGCFFFCFRCLLYNTRGWSVHILAVLCILIISDFLCGSAFYNLLKKTCSCYFSHARRKMEFSWGTVLIIFFLHFLVYSSYSAPVWCVVIHTLTHMQTNKHAT